MGDTISVIVPVYNGAEHLDGFFDTLLTQTYKNLEIICVNDGSTDDSAAVLERYQRSDPRIKVLHQENAGAGVARNTGLAVATGTYLSFLDCDDVFEADMYELLHDKIAMSDADICICDANAVNISTGREKTRKRFIDWTRIPDKDAFSYRDIQEHIFNVFSPVPWNKLYRTKFINDSRLQFQDTKNTNDLFFVYSSLVYAKRITVLDKMLIHKTMIDDSISLSSEKQWRDSVSAYSKLREELISLGIYREVERSFVKGAMSTIAWNMTIISESSFTELYAMLKNGGLESLGLFERDDDDDYNKRVNRRINMIMNDPPEYYRLMELGGCELRRAHIIGGKLRLVVDCPVIAGRSWSGVAIEYKQLWANKINHDPVVYSFPAHVRTKGSVATIRATVPLRDLDLKETTWKVACILEKDGERTPVYIDFKASTAVLVKLFFTHNYTFKRDMIVYFTPEKGFLRLTVRKREVYDGVPFRLKELIAAGLSFLLRGTMKHRKIMLIHEKRCYRAADNGFAFFKYCMENAVCEKQKRDIYYVIDKSSPHYERVKQWDDHVINYLSLKHVLYGIVCSVIVSSESKTHYYVRYASASIVKFLIQRSRHVYLKHGIFAIKKVDPIPFWRQKSVLMTAVSEQEAAIIRRYLRYDRSSIAITGNARFDYLSDKSKGHKEFLLMPSIRAQLFFSGENDFKASNYYRAYSSLLKSEKLVSLLKKHGYALNFYLHPSLSQFEHLFHSGDALVKTVNDDDIPIDELLMRCGMLITDYSSVAWDVLYMNKPTLFYQFDFDLFSNNPGSYMDMSKDLPGDRCEAEEELLDLIAKYAENGLRIPDKYAKMREGFFAYMDRDNCKRIAEEIKRRKL
jgi:glycosyltransferase involved in cell wall biosynthesis/CDP-glycerol glycerophosphotransferase (TagB/SpsB family)